MLSVKAQGEGEYSRLGMVSIMSTRGLSCSEVKALASLFPYFVHHVVHITFIQNIFTCISESCPGILKFVFWVMKWFWQNFSCSNKIINEIKK